MSALSNAVFQLQTDVLTFGVLSELYNIHIYNHQVIGMKTFLYMTFVKFN